MRVCIFLFIYLFFFLGGWVPCGILVPWPVFEFWALSSENANPKHWATREVL